MGLLKFAKNRLNKFYNPKLYKAPPKRELTGQERLTVSLGGTVTTPAPGGIANTGIGAFFVQTSSIVAPGPPPATFSAYQSKAETEAKADTTVEHMNTVKEIGSLHGECDWLVQYFEVRKQARADEIESLSNAKAVLNGATYSLIQQSRLRGVSKHA